MKKVVPAHVRAAERENDVRRNRVARLCADIAAQMTEAGWTNVKVEPKARFITVSGIDPKGVSHGGAREDGQSLADFLISLGIPFKRNRTQPEETEAPPAKKEQASVTVDPVAAELAALRARAEAAEKRAAELEARQDPPPVPLPPNPEEGDPDPIAAAEESVEDEEPLDPHSIPDLLESFAEPDETASEFRQRLKLLWQRFGIEEGKNFPGGGEALSASEKINMREIDMLLNSDEGKNARLLEWLKADPQT